MITITKEQCSGSGHNTSRQLGERLHFIDIALDPLCSAGVALTEEYSLTTRLQYKPIKAGFAPLRLRNQENHTRTQKTTPGQPTASAGCPHLGGRCARAYRGAGEESCLYEQSGAPAKTAGNTLGISLSHGTPKPEPCDTPPHLAQKAPELVPEPVPEPNPKAIPEPVPAVLLSLLRLVKAAVPPSFDGTCSKGCAFLNLCWIYLTLAKSLFLLGNVCALVHEQRPCCQACRPASLTFTAGPASRRRLSRSFASKMRRSQRNWPWKDLQVPLRPPNLAQHSAGHQCGKLEHRSPECPQVVDVRLMTLGN